MFHQKWKITKGLFMITNAFAKLKNETFIYILSIINFHVIDRLRWYEGKKEVRTKIGRERTPRCHAANVPTRLFMKFSKLPRPTGWRHGHHLPYILDTAIIPTMLTIIIIVIFSVVFMVIIHLQIFDATNSHNIPKLLPQLLRARSIGNQENLATIISVLDIAWVTFTKFRSSS